MAPTCEQYLQLWLTEIEAPTPDPARTTQAAHNLASCLGTAPRLQQLVRTAMDGRDDRISCDTCQARLPDYIQAQLEAIQAVRMDMESEEVRDHLALCPYCLAAYAEVTELLLASQADTIPVAATYPVFNAIPISPALSPKSATPAWSTDTVQRAIAAGQQWVQDTLGGVYLLLAQTIQTQPEASWALKSSAAGTLLAQIVLGEDEIIGWEIEASVFADVENFALCRVEVALYNIDDPSAPLNGITVTLHSGDITHTRLTDEGGVAEFADVPRTDLAHMAIRVALRG